MSALLHEPHIFSILVVQVFSFEIRAKKNHACEGMRNVYTDMSERNEPSTLLRRLYLRIRIIYFFISCFFLFYLVSRKLDLGVSVCMYSGFVLYALIFCTFLFFDIIILYGHRLTDSQTHRGICRSYNGHEPKTEGPCLGMVRHVEPPIT